MNITLEYSGDDDLMATFNCTAFGGHDAEIIFVWSTEDPHFSISTYFETSNADYSITSTATTAIDSTRNRRSLYSCCVHFYYGHGFVKNCETATINIGKKILQ